MARHTIEPTSSNVRGSFSRDHAPILHLDPGDTAVIRTLDSRWNLEPHSSPGVVARVLEHSENGHCLCGPIFVRGAEPGMVLGIHIRSLVPAEWGWTEAASKPTTLNRRLGVAANATALLWKLDRRSGVAIDQAGRMVEQRPFLGVIGLAPAEPGTHSTIPPRRCGGNIDCKELVAGSTLYLPVACEGALLSVGDGHAAQGDGELCGTAIECGMTCELGFEVLQRGEVSAPCAVTPAGRVTFGFDTELNEAMFQAADAMVSWLGTLLKVDRGTALALASLVVDLRVTQVVNEVWGVHAFLGESAFRTLTAEERPTDVL